MPNDNEQAAGDESPDLLVSSTDDAHGDGASAEDPVEDSATHATDEHSDAVDAFDAPSKGDDGENEPEAATDEPEPEAKADEPQEPEAEAKDEAVTAEKSKPAEAKVPTSPDEVAKIPRRLLRQTLAEAVKETAALRPKADTADKIADHIKAAGLDGKGLYGLVEMVKAVNAAKDVDEAAMPFLLEALAVKTAGKSRSSSKADHARLLREMADRLSPIPKPKALPDNLAALVEVGDITEEQARVLANHATPETPEPEVASRVQPETPRYSQNDLDSGASAVVKVEQEMRSKYPQEFARWLADIRETEMENIRDLPPAKWANQVRKEFDLRIAKRAPSVKVPTKSPAPKGAGSVPTKKPSERQSVLEAFG